MGYICMIICLGKAPKKVIFSKDKTMNCQPDAINDVLLDIWVAFHCTSSQHDGAVIINVASGVRALTSWPYLSWLRDLGQVTSPSSSAKWER